MQSGHGSHSLFTPSAIPVHVKTADAHLHDAVILAPAIRCTAALATHSMVAPLRFLVVPAPRALLRFPINFYLIGYSQNAWIHQAELLYARNFYWAVSYHHLTLPTIYPV